MKKLLALAAIAALALPSSAFAALEGRLTINGKVPENCEISVRATDLARDILDISAGDSNRLVGYAYEKCNDPAGYTVDMIGLNSGDFTGLFKDTESDGQHPFAVTYGGDLVKRPIVTDSDVAAPDFIEREVRITYGINSALPSSDGFTYSETLKFTISAK